jgi:putative SOS response-associated peptidase YedK
MCGRFALVATPEELASQFHLNRKVTIAPSYNIAPSQRVIIVRSGANGHHFLCQVGLDSALVKG